MTQRFIYGLFCPRTGQLRYIGAAKKPEQRLKGHLREARQGARPVHNWIRELASEGLAPKLDIVTETHNWDADERAAIRAARELGCELLNIAPGGNEPYCSLEQRKKNGATSARVVHDNPKRRRLWELKRALGEAMRDGLLSEWSLTKLEAIADRRPELLPPAVVNALHARARAREGGES